LLAKAQRRKGGAIYFSKTISLSHPSRQGGRLFHVGGAAALMRCGFPHTY